MSYKRRKVKTGRVVSCGMDKTIVVSVDWKAAHRVYKKSVRKRSKFNVHDENNQCGLGDVVNIIETRPLSKTKRWKILEVLQKGDVAELQPKDISVEQAS